MFRLQKSLLVKFRGSQLTQCANLSSGSSPVPSYPFSVQVMHWTMGGAMLGCVGFVQAAKNTKGKTKGRMMFLHKSCGLLAAGLMVPRLAVRAIAKMPPAIGHAQWEKAIADLSHRMMYAFIVIMPMTGVAMGYFGGKGLPFFYTTLPGATEKNGTIAKYAFEVHHYAGQAMEYLLVAHLGGVAFHMMKGQHILARIIPGLAK